MAQPTARVEVALEAHPALTDDELRHLLEAVAETGLRELPNGVVVGVRILELGKRRRRLPAAGGHRRDPAARDLCVLGHGLHVSADTRRSNTAATL
jgi:hypothetical protein